MCRNRVTSIVSFFYGSYFCYGFILLRQRRWKRDLVVFATKRYETTITGAVRRGGWEIAIDMQIRRIISGAYVRRQRSKRRCDHCRKEDSKGARCRTFTLERRRHGWSSVVKVKNYAFLRSSLSLLPGFKFKRLHLHNGQLHGVKPIRDEMSWWESNDVKGGWNGILVTDMLVHK